MPFDAVLSCTVVAPAEAVAEVVTARAAPLWYWITLASCTVKLGVTCEVPGWLFKLQFAFSELCDAGLAGYHAMSAAGTVVALQPSGAGMALAGFAGPMSGAAIAVANATASRRVRNRCMRWFPRRCRPMKMLSSRSRIAAVTNQAFLTAGVDDGLRSLPERAGESTE